MPTDPYPLRFLLFAIDLAAVVMIWMVQWMIYPSFLYYDKRGLVPWHRKYAPRMGRIAAPLMVIQLAGYAFLLIENFNGINVLKSLCVLLTWVLTMGWFVPLHSQISTGQFETRDLNRLVSLNFLRAWTWTFLFILEAYSLMGSW